MTPPRRTATPSTSRIAAADEPPAPALPRRVARRSTRRARRTRSAAEPLTGPAAVPHERRGRLPRPAVPRPAVPGDRCDRRHGRARPARRAAADAARAASSTGAGDGAAGGWTRCTVDCALQLQVIWARLNWDVTLLPAEIGAAARRVAAGSRATRSGTSSGSGPTAARRSATPTTSSPARAAALLGTLTDVGHRHRKALNRLAGAGAAHEPESGGRHHRHVVPVPRGARPRRLLAEHPRQGRRGLGPAAGGVGPRRLLRPRLPRRGRHVSQARRLPRRRWRRSTRSRTAIPPVAVGGEPDQWLALQVARDALADAGALDLPAAVRERTAIILGKGTYLNGGNADRRAARARDRADAGPAAAPAPRVHRGGARGAAPGDEARAAAARPRTPCRA